MTDCSDYTDLPKMKLDFQDKNAREDLKIPREPSQSDSIRDQAKTDQIGRVGDLKALSDYPCSADQISAAVGADKEYISVIYVKRAKVDR